MVEVFVPLRHPIDVDQYVEDIAGGSGEIHGLAAVELGEQHGGLPLG
jgi:hypothetical protein